MNWCDEKYVKLYARDTLTWRSWPWQAKALWPLVLRKLDGAGIMETGRMDPVEAVALQVELPAEVVRPGLAAIIASGTLREVVGGLEAPAFIAAQEARKTEAAKKRDQRERTAAQRRNAQVDEIRDTPVPTASRGVPPRPAVSPDVPLQPSPAQPVPSPAQPERTPAVAVAPPAPRPTKRVDPSDADPRHQPLVDAICREFAQAIGQRMPFSGRDAVGVKALLGTGTDPAVIVEAWRRALRHRGFPTVRTPGELHQHLAHFVGAAPAEKSIHVVGDFGPGERTTVSEGF